MLIQNTQPLPYRPDIDGLRAIAVVAVVLYHFIPSFIPGGFIGVDIFFVISGYLISSIILRQLGTNNFSFTLFYKHRIWRLFPALILVLTITICYGLARLQIDELAQLAKHALSSTFFIANFIFLKESGYFDAAAESKPLLHLWSLSIEEQFYLLWPLALFFVYKHKQHLPKFLALLFICSFGLCLYQMSIDPINAFYLPYTRFWELFAGAALAIYQQSNLHRASRKEVANLQSALGLALLICGFWGLSPNSLFAGWWAMVPVIGSILLISAGQEASINRLILSHRMGVGIGLISYPIYLWHTPLLAYFNIETGYSQSVLARLALILLSICLALLTYRYIEQPLRIFRSRNFATCTLISAMLLVGALSGGILIKLRYERETPSPTTNAQADFYRFYADAPHGRWRQFFEAKFRHDCNFFQVEQFYAGHPTNVPKASVSSDCFTRNSQTTHSVMLWGDSHAQMLNSGLVNNLPADWQVLQVASSGCTPSIKFSQESKTEYCSHSNWFALRTIMNTKPDVVILAQHDFHLASDLNALAAYLLSIGVKKVLIIGPAPRWKDDLPKLFIRQLWAEKPVRTTTGVDTSFMRKNDNLKRLVVQTPQIQYVDLMNLMCNVKGCLTMIGTKIDHNLTTWDRGHLTDIASDYVAANLLVPIILH